MKTVIQLKISDLKQIILNAENSQKYDSSLSNTIEFELIKSTNLHLGNDLINVTIKSNYAECNGLYIFKVY